MAHHMELASSFQHSVTSVTLTAKIDNKISLSSWDYLSPHFVIVQEIISTVGEFWQARFLLFLL